MRHRGLHSAGLDVSLCGGSEAKFGGCFNLCLQVGLTQTGDKTPQTWRIVHFNSHFHLSALWEHKQSRSAVTQLLSCTNAGPWSSAGFVAAKDVADITPTSAGLKPSLGSSALLPAFPLSWSYTHGVWGAPGPSNPTRAALGGVHGHEHHEWPNSCIIYLNSPSSLWFPSNTHHIKNVPGVALGKAEPDSQVSLK